MASIASDSAAATNAGAPGSVAANGNDAAASVVVDSPASSSPPNGSKPGSAGNAAGSTGAGAPPVRSATGYASAAAKSLPTTRRHSGEVNGAGGISGMTPASPAAAASGTAAAVQQPRGEDSLSATLERLRLNAQAAKNGAQNGGVGAIGSRDGRRGPATQSRLAKSAHSGGINPNHPGAAAAQAAALARGGSNAGSAAGGDNSAQMSNFLFDDELDAELHNSTYGGRYLQMNADDDKFPVLIRRDSYPGILSAGSAALDLASLSQTPPRSNAFMRGEAGQRTSEWPQFAEQQGKAGTPGSNTPATGAAAAASGEGAPAASPSSRQLPVPRATAPPASAGILSAGTPPTASAPLTSATAPTSGHVSPSAQNDNVSPSKHNALPLPAAVNGSASNGPAGVGAAPSSPEDIKRKQQLQRERERLDRASAANQNPALMEGHKFSDGTPSPAAMYAGELAALNGTFSPYPLDRPGFAGGYEAGGYGRYGAGGPGGRGGPGGPAGGPQQKREEPNRFAGLRLEDLQGDMAALCKDQHGCRFLQKKLEEGNPEHRDMIYAEIYPHFGELMTDSFGNYLSQKLLEHSTDEQRDSLLESISGELVSISLNMHGTRAVQKMIDYLSTQRQVQSLIMALNLNVVTLIKDLNGNHVVQKCLNTLPPEDNQFIYNAVAANCIEVATHRHGCCVLQRCIDHASESQRIQLVTEITYNSLTLVLDPFGNYVVQYVLDLNDSRFITAIVNQFRNNVCALSAQKFSSNVVEKCVRVADLEGRKALISELIDRSRLERMLRDSFANYVVQTALDYAEPGQRAELVAIIRPVLPMIRNTPYGKRIQSKIQREGFQDGYGRGGYGGHHPGFYGGMGGMGGPGGYYGMPPNGGGPYGPPHHGGHHGQHHGPHHGGMGPQHHHPNAGGPHHQGGQTGPGGPPAHHYGGPQQGGPNGPPGEYMGRNGPGGPPGPYGHGYPGHMAPPHVAASPAMSQGFTPYSGPSPVPMDYPQQGSYPYL